MIKLTDEKILELELRAAEKAKAEGIAEGRAEVKAEIAIEMIKEGLSLDLITKLTNLSIETLQTFIDSSKGSMVIK